MTDQTAPPRAGAEQTPAEWLDNAIARAETALGGVHTGAWDRDHLGLFDAAQALLGAAKATRALLRAGAAPGGETP